MPVSYPADFRDRAIRLVHEIMESSDPPVSEFEAIRTVSSQLGPGMETIRRWIRRVEVDSGHRPGLTSAEHAEIKRLRKENHELKMANEILSTASAGGWYPLFAS